MAEITRTIRVIREWEFEVPAEYGDTDESLKAKVTEAQLDNTPPNAERRVIVLTPEQQADYEAECAREVTDREAKLKKERGE